MNHDPENRVPEDSQQPPESLADPAKTGWGGVRSHAMNSLKNLDLLSFVDWASKSLQKRGASFFGRLITILLCTYFLSDLSALIFGKFIPEPSPARPISAGTALRPKFLEEYNVISARNLFNSKGLIPGEDTTTLGTDLGGPPVRTTLPLNLIGTLILQDELRSIATIEDKSAAAVYPVRVEDEIPSKVRILKIEASKVIFVNISSGRREYVDLPEDPSAQNPKITLGSRPAGGIGINQVSPTNFNIARTEIDRAMADFNNILTQARAVPHFENGIPSGYKLFQIVPGSIYQKLGFQNGDVITNLNGESANDPSKALAALQGLKDQKHFEITGTRDGRPFTYSYDFQ